MKKFLMMTLFVMLFIGTFIEDGYGQTVGDLIQSGTLTTTLVNNDSDTLTFRLNHRINSNRDIGLWIKIEYTSGTEDSISVDFVEAVSLDSDGENSVGVTAVVDNLSLADNTWLAYNISPILSEFVKIIITHAELGSTLDNSNISVQLLYR